MGCWHITTCRFRNLGDNRRFEMGRLRCRHRCQHQRAIGKQGREALRLAQLLLPLSRFLFFI